MSILIKGAKMPSEGNWITVCIYPNGKCAVLNRQGGYKNINALEIPPHGYLIDADKLKDDIPETDADCFENCRDCTLLHQEDVWDIIDDAPTVIESEVEE